MTTNEKLLAENAKLRAHLQAANERAERAEAQLLLPTELVPLKHAAFNSGVNYELLATGICTRRVGGRRLEAVSKLVVRRAARRAAP
jgi:hypothetical protein